MANSPLVGNQCGVRIYFAGQFGNQLFHFVLGKILAAKYDLAFDPPPAFVDYNGAPVKWTGAPLFTMQPTVGRRFRADTGKLVQFGALHWYDFDNLPRDRPLHVCYGHWCRYELYQAWKTQIKEEWLKISQERFVETDDDAVYIHVRRTDFILRDEEGHLDRSCYNSATELRDFAVCLDRFPAAKRLVIVTDNPADPFHAGFSQLGLPFTISARRWDEDFLLLASCRHMIMSTSTFSWWAGWLGKAEKIVCPMPAMSYWGRGVGARGSDREHLVNLYPDDEPERWEFVVTE